MCDVNRHQILEFHIFLFRSLYVVTYKLRTRLRILVRILYVVRFRIFALHILYITYGEAVICCNIRGVYSTEAWTQPASLKKTRGNENHAYFRENWGEEKLRGEERLNYLST